MKTLIDADAIRHRVKELAAQIESDHQGRPLLIVGVLTGCLVFLADLIRQMNLPLRIHLVQASSYRGEATAPGELSLRLDGLPDLTGREVLLIDDILDTGQTLSRLVAELRSSGPASVRVAVLLRKLGRQSVALEPDYTGFEIPDEFVVGYGLDYNDEYRHLPFIGILQP
jgi:hypoxanthine phosphoribosyltransferase